jgi:hypothetical protein
LLIHYGKREIVRSLGTSKKREASAAGYEQGHSWTRDFARIRAGGLQTVPRAIAEAQGLLEALDALPIEQAGERPEPKRAKVLLRTIDDDFVTKTCGTYLNEIDGADAEVRANRGMHLGRPAATTRMSARIVNCARSRVLAWQMQTVASRCISIRAVGLPTMLLAPTTTTFCPAIGIPSASRSFCPPQGVQGELCTLFGSAWIIIVTNSLQKIRRE